MRDGIGLRIDFIAPGRLGRSLIVRNGRADGVASKLWMVAPKSLDSAIRRKLLSKIDIIVT